MKGSYKKKEVRVMCCVPESNVLSERDIFVHDLKILSQYTMFEPNKMLDKWLKIDNEIKRWNLFAKKYKLNDKLIFKIGKLFLINDIIKQRKSKKVLPRSMKKEFLNELNKCKKDLKKTNKACTQIWKSKKVYQTLYKLFSYYLFSYEYKVKYPTEPTRIKINGSIFEFDWKDINNFVYFQTYMIFLQKHLIKTEEDLNSFNAYNSKLSQLDDYKK